jgi:F-type H+-transporting ATPase subunit epsilon
VAELTVEVVSAERKIWTGEVDSVIAKTTEGEIGVLPGHSPVLAQLAEGGVVRLLTDGDEQRVAAHGGFLSVTDAGVSILAEQAEIEGDIDVSRARSALDRAQGADADDSVAAAARHRAQARLRAAGESV